MLIETERLIIKTFTEELCEAAMTGNDSIYKKINIIPNVEWPEQDLKEAMNVFMELIRGNGITGYGSWILLDKGNHIIGSAGFVGEPVDGVIEIGFGIIPSQQNKGYCTEAVNALIEWAKQQGKVKEIISYCKNDNVKSKGVLDKTGFKRIGNEKGLIKWVYKGIGT